MARTARQTARSSGNNRCASLAVHTGCESPAEPLTESSNMQASQDYRAAARTRGGAQGGRQRSPAAFGARAPRHRPAASGAPRRIGNAQRRDASDRCICKLCRGRDKGSLRGKIVTRDACASVSGCVGSRAALKYETGSSLLFGCVFARARYADVRPMRALSHAALLTHADPWGADVRKLKRCLELADLAASNAAHRYDRACEGTAWLRADCGKLCTLGCPV